MSGVTEQPLLDIRNLTVRFGAQAPVLDDITLSLRRREILGVVGETGAGKSILARAIIDLLPPGGAVSGGTIHVEGEEVRHLNAERKRRLRGGEVSLIGTNAKSLLDPVVTVGAQVARVLRAHRPIGRREAWAATIRVFEQVGIVNAAARARAYPHELSGGMAQRVVIAMALIADPKLVLADDATLGLDASIQAQVLDLLVAAGRERGLGVMLITHDLGIVSKYCDKVAVMQQGRLVELQPVRPFMRRPDHAYSESLLNAARARPTPVDDADRMRHELKTPLLTVDNLEKTFVVDGGQSVVRAVDRVSFSLARGETLALVGESGSGKTTVGQCLLKLLPADSGAVRFDGQDILPMTEARFRPVRQRMQMVFQEPYVALNPRWRVEDLIGEPLTRLAGKTGAARAESVSRLLELVHLPRAAREKFPHELTAGQQKRIGIARALATEPDFIVFDEPTTALDIRVRAQIIDLIRDLQRSMGLSALFITHDLNSVRSLAHNVAVMQRGRIVERGETEAIFGNPQHDYTKMLLAAELPIGGEGHDRHDEIDNEMSMREAAGE